MAAMNNNSNDNDGNNEAWKTIAYLSQMVERDKAVLTPQEQYDIALKKYGAQPLIIETPELISRSLQLLEQAIDNIEGKEAYETALFVIPDHVTDKHFVFAFLRADRFDANAAAQRIVNYWERKVELFGINRAFHPYLSVFDLKEEDYPAFRMGHHRLLPNSDGAGRALIFRYYAYADKNVDSLLRQAWYMYHKALWNNDRSDEIQRKGFVYLVGIGPRDHLFPFEKIQDAAIFFTNLERDMKSVLPIQVVAIHLLARSSILVPFHIVYQCVSPFIRKLVYTYAMEKVDETTNELSRCGIDREDVPEELGGELDFDFKESMLDEIMQDLSLAEVYMNDDYYEVIPESILSLALYFKMN